MDEQTTPKKVRRVGSIAFALVLIAAGVLLIVYQFVPQFDLLKILKFSPVILIALGIEMLVYSARPDVKVKFDWLAMLGTAFTLCIVGTAALLPLAISEWNPAREYARNRIESQKADAMYSALTADPAFQGFGRTTVGADGAWRFRTIRPAPYTGRTPHIHVKVRLGTRELLTTQLYVEGDPGNARDFLWRSLDEHGRRALTQAFSASADGLQAAYTLIVAA